MGRSIHWLVLGVVVAGAAAFLLLGGEDPAGDEGPLSIGGLEDDGPGEAAPGLRGAGRLPPAGVVVGGGSGRYSLHGTVYGPDGKPRAGVEVVAHRTGPAWVQGDPTTWNRSPERRIEQSFRRLADPEADPDPLAGRSVTDGEGAYHIRVAESGQYELRARPAPPLVGTYGSASVHDHAVEAEQTLHVSAGSALRGRVVDAQDRPVACVLTASSWSNAGGQSRAWKSDKIVVSAGDGAFAFPAVPEGTVRIAVAVAGRRLLSGFHVEAPHEGEYVIRVPAGGCRVFGVVADGAGTPVAGARVMLSVASGAKGDADRIRASMRGLSGADGRYVVDGLLAGELAQVTVLAEGFLPKSERTGAAAWTGAATSADRPLELPLALERGGHVHGRILLQGKGTPIAGAQVRLFQASSTGQGMSGRALQTVADEQGAYEFPGVPRGRYVIVPTHPEHFLPQVAGGAGAPVPYNQQGSAAPAALTVVITGDASDVERDVELGAGMPVGGRVVGPDGKGVAGAEVHAKGYSLNSVAYQWGIGGMGSQPLATSGGDGSFESRSLPPKEGWLLYAKKEGFVGAYADAISLAPGSPAPKVELTLGRGGTLRGRVLSDGVPVEGSQVGVWGANSELSTKSTFQRVKPDGRFELTDIPPGDWTLNVWVSGRSGKQQPITGLKPGEVREGIVIEIAGGVEVSGVLVDTDGKPLGGTPLLIRSVSGHGQANTTTNGDGTFRFEGVVAGRSQLSTWGQGGSLRNVGAPFTAPATDLRIVVEREKTTVLRGDVLDADGDPVPICTVVAKGTSAPQARNPYSSSNQDSVEAVNGKWTKTVTGDAPFTVSVRQPRDERGQPMNLLPKTQEVTDPTQPIVIRLEKGSEISGRVTDAVTGKPLPNVTVMSGERRVQTGADGRWKMAGLGENAVQVLLHVTGGYVRPAARSAAPGATDVDFALVKGKSIRGVALGADGTPAGQGFVNATWPAAGDEPAGGASAQVGAKGAFAIEGIPPDAVVRVQLQIWGAGGAGTGYAPAVVEGVRPGTVGLEIRVGQGLTIEGVVVGPDGKPPTGILYVYGQSKGEGRHYTGWVQVGEGGAWKLTGLRPETYRMQVQRQDGGARPTPVDVEAPATGVRLVLPRSAEIRGRIEGLGDDAAKWGVRAWRPDGTAAASGRVAADGSWSIAGLPDEGTYAIGAVHVTDGRYAYKAGVKPGATGVLLRLQQGLRITGVVERPPNAPNAGGTVVAKGESWHTVGVIDPISGAFEVVGLPPGTYGLAAHLSDDGGKSAAQKAEAGATGVRLLVEAK